MPVSKSGYLKVDFAGTNKFLRKMQSEIKQRTGIKINGHLNTFQSTCNHLQYNENASSIQIYDWLYSQAIPNLFLKRKQAIGNFYKSVRHLPRLERRKQYDLFHASNDYQKLITCQVPSCECPQRMCLL